MKRNLCVVNNTDDLEEILTISKFPLYCGCVNTDPSEDVFYDMKWGVSKSSNIVQLMDLVNLDDLYRQHHNSGSVGKIWTDHHKKFSEFICVKDKDSILEIGGASGNLISHFIASDQEFKWSVLEPSSAFNINDRRVKHISDYLESHDFKDNRFDTVIHSHVIEHSYAPLEFLQKIHSLLKDGGQQFISMPNIGRWVEKGYTNALGFEHTYYLDEFILQNLLGKAGFDIVSMKVDDHSIFIHSVKSDQKLNENIKSDSLDKYTKYLNDLQNRVIEINKFIGSDKVYLFGAHVFSQVLLKMGVKESSIISILDDDTLKHGLRLYGTSLSVEPTEALIGQKRPKVIVDAGPYTEQIKNNIRNNINNSVVFYDHIDRI